MKKLPASFTKFHCFIREQDGTLVEFALVMPVLTLLLFTIIEMGFMLIIKTNLQAGVTAGARYGTMNAASGGNTVAAISSAILAQAGGLINTLQITITIQYYATFTAVSGSNPNNLTTVNSGTPGAGQSGNIVSYQAQYTYAPITPIIKTIVGNTKVLTGLTYAKN